MEDIQNLNFLLVFSSFLCVLRSSAVNDSVFPSVPGSYSAATNSGTAVNRSATKP